MSNVHAPAPKNERGQVARMMRRTLPKGGLAGLLGLGSRAAVAAPAMTGFLAPEETHRHTRALRRAHADRA
jgi:hypothetical protein